MTPNALQLFDPTVTSDNPLQQGIPSLGQGVAATGAALWNWLQNQRAISMAQGQLNPATGMPTQAGLVNAAQQYGNALLLGTTAPEEGGAGFSLEQVNPRTLKPLSSASDMTQGGSHAFSVKNAAGDPVGTVDTEWSPDTGNLHIADFQSNEGARSLGFAAIRQIRDQLLARYPGVKTLSGQRITGAVSADTMSGAGPGRFATQVVNQ